MSTLSSYHHGDLRNALLAAAEGMIDADVRREFSLRELAREAGVSHAAPYKHFSSRDSLVEELAARWMSEFVTAQETVVTGDDARADLLAAGVAYVEWAGMHPSRFSVIFDPAVNQGPDRGPLAALASRHSALLTSLVERAAAAEAPDAALDLAAQRLWATVHGLATLVILGHVSDSDVRGVLDDALW